MTTIIRFEGPDVWEEHEKSVNEILESVGLDEGDYPQLDNLFPPVKLIPFELKQLDEETIERLRELRGVIVEVENEDDD
ncbi:hypothetical protein AWENTII_010326 [Aspergillus wentii]|nr:hypothetical protein MW887_009511 [Aspergillus wentii]